MTTLAAVAAPFGRDLDAVLRHASTALRHRGPRARARDLLVLPEACLGGYLADLGAYGANRCSPRDALPPALDLDGPEIARLAALAGDLVVSAGFCEADGAARYNTRRRGDRRRGARRAPQGAPAAGRERAATPRATASAPSTRRSAGSAC